MLRPLLLLTVSFCWCSAVLWAGPLPGQLRVEDRGASRQFELVREGAVIVLYEPSQRRTVYSRRVVTTSVLVQFSDVSKAVGAAQASGAISWRWSPSLHGAACFEYASPEAALQSAEVLGQLDGVTAASPLLAKQQVRRWLPNDPYFSFSPGNQGYQWHLRNTGQNRSAAALDVNVTAVWDQWRGNGIRIAIVDDGLQTSHPDLSANVDTANDYDWNGNDADPSPSPADTHGTACAGVTAARGNNGAGVCGVAPEATLVGLRLIAFGSTDTSEAAALLHRNDLIQVKSNSWGPEDDGDVVEGPGAQAAAALEQAATMGRGGLGSIICWASGNGGTNGDDSNFDGYANSIYVIASGAVDDTGVRADYSEPGSNLLISAPSDGGAQGISTTDLAGASGYNSGAGGNFASADYTNDFGGTSSACPLVAGGIALMLQAKPSLGWRDVKEILIRSSTKVDPAHPGWFTNAGGFHFNDQYGAGMLNVGEAVSLAAGWSNLEPVVSRAANNTGSIGIPDNSTAGAVKTFVISGQGGLRVEQVTLHVNVLHDARGHLEFQLTSPSGTVCRLARPRSDTRNNLDWTFGTPQFWGEPGGGTWTLQVRDTVAGTAGSLVSAALTVYGTGSGGPPVITSAAQASALTGVAFSFQPAATNAPVSWSATSLPPGLFIDSVSGLISGMPQQAGAFTLQLSASNAAGSAQQNLVITVTSHPPGLAEALDVSAVPVTSSSPAWFGQSQTTADGLDAAQSAAIGHNSSSAMEIQLTGPVTLTFRWKVSSEASYDQLKLFIDGAEVRAISGEQGWITSAHHINGGVHSVRWVYSKDNSVSAGADAGWVDQLRIQPSVVPLVAGGLSTGFQEPELNADFYVRGAGALELGWIASGGRTAEAGNRAPPLTGASVGGLPGVKSFQINSTAAGLRIDIVDTQGWVFLAARAKVRAYTTGTNNFESGDNLKISTEVSSDAITWAAGPEIVPLRKGGAPDDLIALNTAAPDVYVNFAAAPAAWATPPRYVRLVLQAATDSTAEYLVVDDLWIGGTPATADQDSDGYPAGMEAWFGTPDSLASAFPLPAVSRVGAAAQLTFPSIQGNSYTVEVSPDLTAWVPYPVVGAAGPFTLWLDPEPAGPAPRFYRVRKP